MVALKKYDRIEAAGLWRASPHDQRREVVAVLGDATLTIKSMNDQPLAHWSIAAIDRANPRKTPAIYHPDGDPDEELELNEDEVDMVEAIETLRRAIDRARPRPGRLRAISFALSIAAVVYAAIFWFPGALVDHTVSVVPEVARKQIGQSLLTRIQRVTGPSCGTSANNSSLARLAKRLNVQHISVMRGGLETAQHLPGGHILLARQLVEDHEEPDVAAGFVMAERARTYETDPLRALLNHAGTLATFRLLTTGRVQVTALDAYGEHLLRTPKTEPSTDSLVQFFAASEVRTTPYAYAIDMTGESVLPLIEGDPMRDRPLTPIMDDADWLRLQAICDD